MYIVDRIEGNIAVLEKDDEFLNIELFKLPANIKEGSVLKLINGEFLIDEKAEEERRNALFLKTQNLFKRKNNGQ